MSSLTLPVVADAQTSSKTRTGTAAKARTPNKNVARGVGSPWTANPAVNSRDSYLVVDAVSGRELAADRPDELRHPASLAKLMTLYLTFSALDSGRLSLGDSLPVSLNVLNAPPTKMGMTSGSVMVRDAVMGLITRSANDAALALAEALAGNEESFARQMTLRARQLGMSSTVFHNASGLPHREQVTTARDMAKLAHALLRDYPHYYPVFSVQSYFYKGRSLENHNRMLASYAGSDGLKTGYTNASGFNLVMSAMRDNRRLIGVVMGGDSAFQRDRQMAELMDRSFAIADAVAISPWTSPRKPPSARYAAANFVPGVAVPDAPRVNQVAKAEPAAPQAGALRVAGAPANLTAPAPEKPSGQGDTASPAIGSWVIQIGSFSDASGAQLALDRATQNLPDAIRNNGAMTIDEIQMAAKTFHRARVANLSQTEAVSGCKRLERKKIYCSALQVTAWNTPNAR